MDIQTICEDYLQKMNPVAQKMAEDIIKIKEENKQIWPKLDHKEKTLILDKSLINNKLTEEYRQANINNEFQYESLSQFSWFSRSQLELFKYVDTKPKFIVSPLKRSENVNPCGNRDSKYADFDTDKKVKRPEGEDRKKSHVSKPKNPPPPPPKKTYDNYDDDASGDSVPKTGFDFLDNW